MNWSHQLINCNQLIRHTAINKQDIIFFKVHAEEIN